MVMTPRRPVNIRQDQDDLGDDAQLGSYAVDNPTVPNAETHSNSSCMKEYSGSATHSSIVPRQTTNSDMISTMNACMIVLSSMRRLNATQCPFFMVRRIALKITKMVLVLDTAAGRARGSTDEHQDHQDEQACIRKGAQRICGKSSRTGRNTVKECAEPCDVLGQLQTDRTDDDQEAGHRDDHLRMQRELAKAALRAKLP